MFSLMFCFSNGSSMPVVARLTPSEKNYNLKNNVVETSGGRVLGVTALGDSISSAQANAYEALAGISFESVQYRRDIGYRAVAREKIER